MGVGSTFEVRETRTDMYGTHTTTVVEEVKEFVPNKRLVYERLVGEPPATRAVRSSVEVEAVAGGTQITKSYEHLLRSLRAKPLMLGLIFLTMPILRLVEYWDLTRELRRIQSAVEAEQSGGSSQPTP